MSERWDKHFLRMAAVCAAMSKDPDKQVGAILVDEENSLVGGGFNGFPRGIHDLPWRLSDKTHKLPLMVHAERNALLTAARRGTVVRGCTLYVVCIDEGSIWGGVCIPCAMEMIQAGITQVVTPPTRDTSRWALENRQAVILLHEASVTYRECR